MRLCNRSACSVSERAKLCAILLLVTSVAACERDRVAPIYDQAGLLRRLDYDTDRDGRIDMHAYLENGRTIRMEVDGNGDGVIDRWEYYAGDARLERLGTSSESDGVEDTWVEQSGSDMRVDIATRRDGIANRHEFHESGRLVRAEQDTNADGKVDEWQRFSNGQLRELLIDTTLSSNRPDRRLVYGPDGALQQIGATDAGR